MFPDPYLIPETGGEENESKGTNEAKQAAQKGLNYAKGNDKYWSMDPDKLKDAHKKAKGKLKAYLNHVLKMRDLKHSGIKKGLTKAGKKGVKSGVGKVLPFLGVTFFAYDWYNGGIGHAFNEATWPLSEAWD